MQQPRDNMKNLLEKANTLPMRPGVYIMKGAGGVIYIGKSRKLKNRVTQYFRQGEKNAKTAKMVSQVKDFDYYVCDTEIEALSLENTLIKQHCPRYNIKLKDAKSYPYIKITNEAEGDIAKVITEEEKEEIIKTRIDKLKLGIVEIKRKRAALRENRGKRILTIGYIDNVAMDIEILERILKKF